MSIEVPASSMAVFHRLRHALTDPRSNWGRLPDVLPTGEEVKTIEEVASLMNYDLETAAIAVLQNKDAPEHLRLQAKDVYTMSGQSTSVRSLGTRRERRERLVERAGAIQAGQRYKKRRRRKNPLYTFANNSTETRFQLKALHGQPESDFEGIAVMLKVEGFQPWPGGVEDLHITLLYLGTLDSYNGDLDEDDFIERLREYAASEEAIMPIIGGITRFSPRNPDERDPIVANIDSKDVNRMHDDIVAMFGEGPSEHGYTPHMTLAYVDRDDPMPVNRIVPQPVICPSIILGWGKHKTELPLLPYGSTSDTEKEEDE